MHRKAFSVISPTLHGGSTGGLVTALEVDERETELAVDPMRRGLGNEDWQGREGTDRPFRTRIFQARRILAHPTYRTRADRFSRVVEYNSVPAGR